MPEQDKRIGINRISELPKREYFYVLEPSQISQDPASAGADRYKHLVLKCRVTPLEVENA